MRFAYMLHNKDGRGRRVPRGQAWQWTHNLDNLEHLGSMFDWIDLRVSVDHLSLLNVYLDHTEITAPQHDAISFASKSQVQYSKVIMPNRVIDMSLIAAQAPVHGHTFLDLNVLRRTL